MKTQILRKNRGFSLLDMLASVAVIAVLCAIAFPVANRFQDATRRAKLEQDVKTLNSAVAIYLANGGNLDKATQPQEVLDKMKTERSDKNRMQFVGMTGSTVDKRLAARMIPEGETATNLIAKWSTAKQRFELASGGTEGIQEFYLNDAFQEKVYASEDREMSEFAYNENPGWIWKFKDEGTSYARGPTSPPLGDPTDTEPPGPVTPVKLTIPHINPKGGVFPVSDFPKTIAIYSSNPSSTWIEYSVNGGSFVKYTGSFTLPSAGTVIAYATGDPAHWISSSQVSESYAEEPPAPPVQLDPPNIQLSSNHFDETISQISVTINNPNPSGSSNLYYSIVEAQGTHPEIGNWLLYSSPIPATLADYPDGFEVVSYAKSTDPLAFTDSAPSTAFTTAEFFGIPIEGNVLFIVDASSSMENSFGGVSRFEATIGELASSIPKIPANLKFNVAMFDAGNHWTDGTYVLHKATPPNKQALINEVQTVESGSGTNYAAAFAFPPMFDPVPDQVIFLTDGQPSGGYATELAALAALGIRIDAIGIDVGQDELDLLESIAEPTGGNVYAAEPPN